MIDKAKLRETLSSIAGNYLARDLASDVLCCLDVAGLEIVKRPERKSRPDADGEWWVKWKEATRPMILTARMVNETSAWVTIYPCGGPSRTVSPSEDFFEWAIGPLPVPE